LTKYGGLVGLPNKAHWVFFLGMCPDVSTLINSLFFCFQKTAHYEHPNETEAHGSPDMANGNVCSI